MKYKNTNENSFHANNALNIELKAVESKKEMKSNFFFLFEFILFNELKGIWKGIVMKILTILFVGVRIGIWNFNVRFFLRFVD